MNIIGALMMVDIQTVTTKTNYHNKRSKELVWNRYLDLCQRIVDNGTWIENERTGKRCLTVINADLEYDVGNNQFPLVYVRAFGKRQLLNCLATFAVTTTLKIFVS